MATPTYAELLTGHTEWVRKHNGVRYLVSFHGHRTGEEYAGAEPQPGTWCWYLLIPEQMYPHRWDDFAVVPKVSTGEPVFHYDSEPEAFDDLPFHGGITWSSNEPYRDRKSGKVWAQSKIGCDYNHLWDREGGYYHTFQMVCEDAEKCVEAFLKKHPDHLVQSDYSSVWDTPDRFYTAVNGRRVHVDEESKISADWTGWQRPAFAEAALTPA